MNLLQQLIERIVIRVNVNLAEFGFDSENYVSNALDFGDLMKYYAFYGITSHHPIFFHFKHSNIAGSYFLGKCYVGRSAIYKSDVRGDELKRKGDSIRGYRNISLIDDEKITIRDSLLYKTLVHSNSHNLKSPEEFGIRSTISAHYSNIHGTTLQGCFIGPFATVDLMNLHSCIVGEFSYVQAEELYHTKIEPGTVWIRYPSFEFKYRFKKQVLDNYVSLNTSHQPLGVIYDFVQKHDKEYERLFEVINLESIEAPVTSAVNRYAVVKGKIDIGENVLVAQRAYLDNASMGDGSNAQENSYIIDSRLMGENVTAHGGKIICADVGFGTFVGFNSFLNGKPDARITVGEGCIVMPHTIIDADDPIDIPDEHIVWGFIGSQEDIDNQVISMDKLSEIKDEVTVGRMTFTGNGSAFIHAFKERIHHILLANGALFSKGKNRGHAQDGQSISFNTIQPYPTGQRKGLYPSITIEP